MIMVLAFVPVHGQTLTTGALSGRVVDAAGRPVPDALVTMHAVASGLVHETEAGRRGLFSFAFLAAGEYELTVEQIGFAPRRLSGIDVRPGRSHDMTVVMQAASPASAQQQVERFGGAVMPASLYGGSQWLPESAVQSVPAATREAGDVLRMASMADDRWSVEGLPRQLSVLLLDGIAFRPAAHAQLRASDAISGAAFAQSGIEEAELVTNGVDVQWAGAAASYLSATTRRGAAATALDANAFWSGDALPTGGSADVAHTDIQGGAVIRGPLFGTANRFSLGVEARRLQTPFSSAWPASNAAAALIAADPELASYAEPVAIGSDAIAAFGRADWSATARHRVELSAHFAAETDAATLDAAGGRLPYVSSDLIAGATLRSSLGTSLVNELRVGLTRTVRERTGALQVVPTRLVSEDLSFGTATGTPSTAGDVVISVSDALHVPSGTHDLEVGAAVSLGMFDYDHRGGTDGSWLFGDLDDFNAATGVFTRTEGPDPLAEWSSLTLSAFALDRWQAAPGLQVLLGVRLDREDLPASEVGRDGEWFRLTGLANDRAQPADLRISPRAGITWDLNGARDWVLEAGGGFYFDRVDPQILAQWQIDDGSARVRRASGTLNWPDIGTAGVTAPRLTMLAGDFSAPRTARLGIGLTHRIADGTALYAAGVVRRTVNLPRETDLNLLPLAVARDQYGRPVYGGLEQHGGLLTAAAGTSRRFPIYDEVSLISDDGWSEHTGITIGLDRDPLDGYGFLLRYTFGRTTDNWVDAAAGAWGRADPAEADDAGDWAEGTSDFDVPHSAAAVMMVDLPLGVRASGVYRFQSGRPFTPGFRPGVDVDAAGDGTDPAFIDPALPGMDALLSRWDCLRSSEGAFAERNSCRTSAVHALDLRAALTFFRSGSTAASVTVDAFNVLDTWHEQPDAALYLIDPAGTLTSDPVARTVDVPLLVNSEFGKPLARRHSGRRLRLGLSLNW